MSYLTLRTPEGTHYVRAAHVSAAGPAEDAVTFGPGGAVKVRTLTLACGRLLTILDTPDNMSAILDALQHG